MKDYKDSEKRMFAELMRELAEMEGEQLLQENERLRNDPGAAVPQELDRKCRELIASAFADPKDT